uniref:Uncharacterized protein n=1 Tax=Dunaliella tertiolecta TaxID=3047 RepID=A0A7S3R5H1_DUNTE
MPRFAVTLSCIASAHSMRGSPSTPANACCNPLPFRATRVILDNCQCTLHPLCSTQVILVRLNTSHCNTSHRMSKECSSVLQLMRAQEAQFSNAWDGIKHHL